MSSVFRRIAVCLCVFAPVLWAWLAAPSYHSGGRASWQMPGPWGSHIFDRAAIGFATLEECRANPSLLAETFLRYGQRAPFARSAKLDDNFRYMHGLYAMDSIRDGLLREARTAAAEYDITVTLMAGVGAFKNACMKALWMLTNGPGDAALHGLFGAILFGCALPLHLVLGRHAG